MTPAIQYCVSTTVVFQYMHECNAESPKQGSKRFNSQGRRNTLPIWVYNLSMPLPHQLASGHNRFSDSANSRRFLLRYSLMRDFQRICASVLRICCLRDSCLLVPCCYCLNMFKISSDLLLSFFKYII